MRAPPLCRLEVSVSEKDLDRRFDTSEDASGRKLSPYWLQTYTGRRFDVGQPSREDVDVVDIAHALSLLCRFAGATREFYSVAQHSVLVSRACVPVDTGFTEAERLIALWGLLHDASEAYAVDLPAPIKRMPALAGYKRIEKAIQDVVCERFGLPYEMPSSVERADRRMLMTEKRDLLRSPEPQRWDGDDFEPYGAVINPWAPVLAEQMFLARFDALRGR